jgi:hypothetical protein
MADKVRSSLSRAVIAASISIVPGMGQIYLRQFFKGLVLILSFILAICIIWFAMSNKEFKLLTLYGKQIMFNPAMKAIQFGSQRIKVTDIMKVTGTIQLVFTWVYGIVDAWRAGKNQPVNAQDSSLHSK